MSKRGTWKPYLLLLTIAGGAAASCGSDEQKLHVQPDDDAGAGGMSDAAAGMAGSPSEARAGASGANPGGEAAAGGVGGAPAAAGNGGVPAVAGAGGAMAGAPITPENGGAGGLATDGGAAGQSGTTSPPPASAYLYASAGSGKIAGWAFDAATGSLTLLGTSPYDGAATTFSAHPSGKSIFVCDYNAGNVGSYQVATDGALTAVLPRVAAGSGPEVVKVHPSGNFLYAGNVFGGGTSIYTIDPSTAVLTATTPLAGGTYNHGLAFDPRGQYLYLARNNNNDVTRYLIDQQTGLASDPQTVAAAGGYHEAMDPLGAYLFVTDWDKSGGNKVSSYAVSASDGTLTKVGDYDTGGGNPAGIVVTPDGKWVYLVNNSSGSVAGFAIDRATGQLAAVPGSPYAGGSWELCLDESGKWLYAGGAAGLDGFGINPSDGSLSKLAGSPFSTGIAAAPAAGACVLTRAPK